MDIDTNGLIDLERLGRVPHFCVYILIDPRIEGDGLEKIRYVGRTFDLCKRVEQHMSHARRGSKETAKDAWIRELLEVGLQPQLQVLCRCGTLLENKFIEQFFIKFFGRLPSVKLTNGYGLNEKTPGIDEFIQPGVTMWVAYGKALEWFYNQQKDMIDEMVNDLKTLNIPRS